MKKAIVRVYDEHFGSILCKNNISSVRIIHMVLDDCNDKFINMLNNINSTNKLSIDNIYDVIRILEYDIEEVEVLKSNMDFKLKTLNVQSITYQPIWGDKLQVLVRVQPFYNQEGEEINMLVHTAKINFYDNKLQKIEEYKGINNISRINIEIISKTMYHASQLLGIQKDIQRLLINEKKVNLGSIMYMLGENNCVMNASLYISNEIKTYDFNFLGLKMRWTAKNTIDIWINVTSKLDSSLETKLRLNSLYSISNTYISRGRFNNIDPAAIKYCEHDAELMRSPVKVICSGPVTTIITSNGEKYQVRKSNDDKNDYEKAFMMAWLYSLVGEKVTRNTLKKFEDELQKKPEKPRKKKKGETK